MDLFHTVETAIDIDASAALVWQVLVDFSSYPEWNSFITRIDGEPRVGGEITEHLKFRFLPFTVPGKSFVTRVLAGRVFAWRGSFVHGLNRLGRGDHSFELDELAPARTRLIHREEYRGIVPSKTFPLIRRIAEPHFRIMDRDLRARAEDLQRA